MRHHSRTIRTLAAVLALGARAALADTYTVNSTTDAVDAAPGNNVCATASGACTLRAAVQEANAHAGADTITLPAGTFRLNLLGPGEELAATGDLDVTESVTLGGAGPEATTIDGIAFDRCIEAKNGVGLTVRDLGFENCSSDAGGAIGQLSSGTTTIERVRFATNAAMAGGAVLQAGGPLTITDSTFDTNLALGGGGIYFVGSGPLTISGTTFSGNTTLGDDGAAVRSETSGPVSITGSTFSDNASSNDAGSLLVTDAVTATLADSSFERNRAGNQVAGPLIVPMNGLTVTNVRIVDNSAPGIAASLFAAATTIALSGLEVTGNFTLSGPSFLGQAGGAITLGDSTFQNNAIFSGGIGGGIYLQAADVTVTDVEVTGNSASTGGGAIISASATATVNGLHAFGNSAQVVGGFLVAGATVTVTNSTADGNQAIQIGGAQIGATNAATVANSTFSNNVVATPGSLIGGLLIGTTNPSTLSNVTFSGNQADTQIGALYTAGPIEIRNATFVGNVAPMDSAISNSGGTLTLVSTIIAGGGADACGGTITSGGNNLDQSGTCGLAGSGDQNGVDPQLGPLAANGGPTLTHLPAATSPAIDTGAAAGCPATDQRGQARPADGNGDGSSLCDKGAVEFLDLCPADPNKTVPGICGCGVADTDADQANGTADCLINGELKARIARAKAIIAGLAGDADPLEAELATIGTSLVPYVKAQGAAIQVVNAKPKLVKLARKAAKAVKKVGKAKAGPKLDKAKQKATTALDTMDADVAPQA